MNIIGDPEQRAELARKKYGAMTINEILSRILIFTVIGYLAIVIICILMYFSPIDDRLLMTTLLVFVLVEMLTEYALWAFTYEGMRKMEAPLADLQKFSTITKEGWRRAEVVMDLTTPFFKWLEDIRERIWPDWRESKETPPPVDKTAQIMLSEITEKLKELERKIIETQSQVRETNRVRWGTEHLKD